MSQDTRKDKRAKVVSLNVRYKSATVDEFIENHSHDVSKGGIFVKTPTPFPAGTLLKFEIRLAGDKSVISGVGRVVWKREPTSAGAERPSGMGVKFIKIDDQSRVVIERLTAEKPEAGSAYTSEPGTDEDATMHPSTLRGLVAAEPAPLSSAPSPVSAPPAMASGAKLPMPPPPAASSGAATSGAPVGKPALQMPAVKVAAPVVSPPARAASKLGPAPLPATARPPVVAPPSKIESAVKPSEKSAVPDGLLPLITPPPAPVASAPIASPAPPAAVTLPRVVAPSAASFDANEPERPTATASNRKATMMGVGLPSVPPPPPPPGPVGESRVEPTPPPTKAAAPMFPRFGPESEPGTINEPTVMKQAAELLEEALREAGGSLDEIGQNPLFSKPSGTPQPGPLPAGGVPVSSLGPIAGTPSPTAVLPGSPSSFGSPSSPSSSLASPAVPGVSQRPSSDSAFQPPHSMASSLDSPKKGSGGMVAALVLVLGLAGGGAYAWKSGLLGGAAPPAPTASPIRPVATVPTPSAVPSSAVSTAPLTNFTGSAVAVGVDASADAGAKPTDAGVKADAAVKAEKPAYVAPKPRPRPPTATPTAATATDPSETPTSTIPTPATPATPTTPATPATPTPPAAPSPATAPTSTD